VGFILLFGSMLIVMLLRIAPPIGVRMDGEPIGKVTLGIRERVRLQRTNVYAIGAVLLAAAFAGDMPLIVELAVMVSVLAILAIPVRYVFTARGIALNRTVFRHWSEFRDLEVGGTGIRLVPVEGVRPFRLVLSRDKAPLVARTISGLIAETSRVGDGAPRASNGRGSSTTARGRQRRRAAASAHS
jgi:hypothetical protein